MDAYLRAINRTALLNRAQEADLASRAVGGDKSAEDHLIRANLRLVVTIAKAYIHRGLPMEDLISEGNLGLITGIRKFDPSFGCRVSTYVVYWIRQSIQSALNETRMIRVPLDVAYASAKWLATARRLRGQLGRQPDADEVARNLDVGPALAERIRHCLLIRFAHARELQHAHQRAADVINDEDVVVNDLLEQLEGCERFVVRAHYGLEADRMTLEQIGKTFGMTRQRMQQIEQVALAKLRKMACAAS